jgi:hypothetical protein
MLLQKIGSDIYRFPERKIHVGPCNFVFESQAFCQLRSTNEKASRSPLLSTLIISQDQYLRLRAASDFFLRLTEGFS